MKRNENIGKKMFFKIKGKNGFKYATFFTGYEDQQGFIQENQFIAFLFS